MSEVFTTEIEVLDNGPGVWATAKVVILQNVDGVARKIGSYSRNHSGWCDSTFYPFMQKGQWYALYSPDYTTTRVMELPSCKDIAGEEHASNGFCPVDFYVPFEDPHVIKADHAGCFGFVAGCIWGDDSSWKIQYLDLSKITSGCIVRKELFGYAAMPARTKRLSECVSLDYYAPPTYPRIDLSVEIAFDLTTGKQYDPYE